MKHIERKQLEVAKQDIAALQTSVQEIKAVLAALQNPPKKRSKARETA